MIEINCLPYPDDLVIVAKTISGLQTVLRGYNHTVKSGNLLKLTRKQKFILQGKVNLHPVCTPSALKINHYKPPRTILGTIITGNEQG